MYHRLPYKTKQFFFVLIKLSIVVGASYYVYHRLVNNNELDFRVFVDFLSKKAIFTPKNLFFVLFLTIFNWFFEILKWQVLVKTVKNISFFNSFQQSLGSLTASLFTPNRIGEYGAKAIYYSKRLRKRILLLNLLGNITQMSVTLIFGVIGIYFFLTHYNVEISYYKISRFAILVVMVTAFAVFGITQDRFKIKGFSIGSIKDFIKHISLKTKSLVFIFSVIRYLIFSYQFYFLLSILGVELTYLNTMIGITTMYLLSSIIPMLFIFDVIVKGSVAVYVFGFLGVNEFTILCIITLMWLLNFVLPSLFGSYYVLNFNYTSELE